ANSFDNRSAGVRLVQYVDACLLKEIRDAASFAEGLSVDPRDHLPHMGARRRIHQRIVPSTPRQVSLRERPVDETSPTSCPGDHADALRPCCIENSTREGNDP